MSINIPDGIFNNGTPRRRRKNLRLVNGVLRNVIASGKVKVGDPVSSKQLEAVIIANDLDKHWDRNPNAADANGLKKTLGDAMGGHGLNLRKTKLGYVMPKKLPVVNERNEVEIEATY